ncbi:hypothetical protein GH733_011900 [Mirounga leonina]|nr:hypothetical protein GH733_011900 [Mirounga leonina]
MMAYENPDLRNSDSFKTHYCFELIEKALLPVKMSKILEAWRCIFQKLQCLTSYGFENIWIYLNFLHLHSKTFDCTQGPGASPAPIRQDQDYLPIRQDQDTNVSAGAYKPPMHICSHKISFVNWTCDLTSCSFNFDIETKQGTQYTVRSIKRQMSGKLILLMQNVSNCDKDERDAHLELIKDAYAINNRDDSGEGTNKAFNSGEEEEEMAEMSDSNASASSSSNEDDSDWNEKKRKYLKKIKVHKGCKKPVEMEKGKDLYALKGHIYAHMPWLNAG